LIAADGVELEAMTARYRREWHGPYVDLLERAIRSARRTRVQAIALTGDYGLGKSSVLRELERRMNRRRTHLLALSFAALPGTADSETIESADKVVARVQRELVKQILYRAQARRQVDSRFHRIPKFRLYWEAARASAIAAAAIWLLVRASWHPLVELPKQLRLDESVVYTGTFMLVVGAWLASGRFFARWGRVRIVAAKSQVLGLEAAAASQLHFDEYLDEVVAFIESSPIHVVVLEDLDRHNTPEVLESLRVLQKVLNDSRSRMRRPVTFIYAIRDSLLSQRTAEPEGSPIREQAESVGAKTKYFDLTIPMVPFLSSATSRDFLYSTMSQWKSEIDDQAISMAAHSITDMRTITLVRNEYATFRERLNLAGPNPLGLEGTKLFAMVVFKAMHPDQFEKLRKGESVLDLLYARARYLINREAARLDDESLALERGELSQSELESLSAAATSLLERFAGLLPSPNGAVGAAQVRVRSANGFVDANLGDGISPATWAEMSFDAGSILVTPRGGSDIYLSPRFLVEASGRHDLECLWNQISTEEISVRRAHVTARRHQLRALSMSDLLAADRNLIAGDSEGDLREFVDSRLADGVVKTLLLAGFFDDNYALYAALYNDTRLSAEAMRFQIRHVSRNIPDPLFHFTRSTDIPILLAESRMGASGDLSILNVEIADFLLTEDHKAKHALQRVAGTLGPEARAFIASYLANGKAAESLLELLAPHSTGLLNLLATNHMFDSTSGLAQLNVCIEHADPDRVYDSSPELRALIAEHVHALPAVAAPAPERCAAVARTLETLGVRFHSVAAIDPIVSREYLRTGLLQFTVELLAQLSSDGATSVDAIVGDPQLLTFVNQNFEEYVVGLELHQLPSLLDPAKLGVLLDILIGQPSSVALRALSRAHADAAVADIEEVAQDLWQVLLESARVSPTDENLLIYAQRFGGVDAALADFIIRGPAPVSTDPGVALQLAAILLVTGDEMLSPEHKVQAIRSLKIEPLTNLSALVSASESTLVELLRAGLLADSDALLTSSLLSTWALRREAISRSTRFASAMDVAVLPPEHLSSLFLDEELAIDTGRVVIEWLPRYGVLTPEQARAVVAFSRRTGTKLHFSTVSLLAGAGTSLRDLFTLLELSQPKPDRQQLEATLRGAGFTPQQDDWWQIAYDPVQEQGLRKPRAMFADWDSDESTRLLRLRLK
jgi:hypothetical protein